MIKWERGRGQKLLFTRPTLGILKSFKHDRWSDQPLQLYIDWEYFPKHQRELYIKYLCRPFIGYFNLYLCRLCVMFCWNYTLYLQQNLNRYLWQFYFSIRRPWVDGYLLFYLLLILYYQIRDDNTANFMKTL